MRYLALALVAVSIISCNRDPNYLKQKYLQSGIKYFDGGRYKEASIMYRNAMKQDPRSGEAYYRLALTALKLSAYGDAYRALLRTVDLEPKNNDAKSKLADIYLLSAAQDPQHAGEKLDFAADLGKKLLDQDPKSFDGHRIAGQIERWQLSLCE